MAGLSRCTVFRGVDHYLLSTAHAQFDVICPMTFGKKLLMDVLEVEAHCS